MWQAFAARRQRPRSAGADPCVGRGPRWHRAQWQQRSWGLL